MPSLYNPNVSYPPTLDPSHEPFPMPERHDDATDGVYSVAAASSQEASNDVRSRLAAVENESGRVLGMYLLMPPDQDRSKVILATETGPTAEQLLGTRFQQVAEETMGKRMSMFVNGVERPNEVMPGSMSKPFGVYLHAEASGTGQARLSAHIVRRDLCSPVRHADKKKGLSEDMFVWTNVMSWLGDSAKNVTFYMHDVPGEGVTNRKVSPISFAITSKQVAELAQIDNEQGRLQRFMAIRQESIERRSGAAAKVGPTVLARFGQ